jgi:hypothetical protein
MLDKNCLKNSDTRDIIKENSNAHPGIIINMYKKDLKKKSENHRFHL